MALHHSHSLAALTQGPDRLLGWVVLIDGVLLVLGWVLPIMTVERLLILEEQVSILHGIAVLWANGNIILFLVVLIFTVVFPLLKLGLALYLWFRVDARSTGLARSLGHIERLGRWSMMDVFVVALLVVAIQTRFIDDVQVHAGIYFFTAAIVISILVVQRMTKLAHRALDAQDAS